MPTSPEPSAFPRAVAFVIDVLEGGERPVTDSGWLTRWGISQRSHPTIDVSRITRTDAEFIYKREYWDALKCELLPAAIALLLFASAVNIGNTPAAKILQRAANVRQDGAIGNDTIAAAAESDALEMRLRFGVYWLHHYYAVALEHPTYLQYLDGWNRRALLTLDQASRWDS